MRPLAPAMPAAPTDGQPPPEGAAWPWEPGVGTAGDPDMDGESVPNVASSQSATRAWLSSPFSPHSSSPEPSPARRGKPSGRSIQYRRYLRTWTCSGSAGPQTSEYDELSTDASFCCVCTSCRTFFSAAERASSNSLFRCSTFLTNKVDLKAVLSLAIACKAKAATRNGRRTRYDAYIGYSSYGRGPSSRKRGWNRSTSSSYRACCCGVNISPNKGCKSGFLPRTAVKSSAACLAKYPDGWNL
mmetsp:Transcript_102629/g.296726  ORF Transcript_102629/g.296726 Transcript_102629/m.296726 type:complete len:243 (-) Transcript_102629:696-1424(-)